jgi:integrase
MSNSKSIAKKEVKKPPKKYREGLVTYLKRGNRWSAYYTDKGTGKPKWKALGVDNQRAARIKARDINNALEGGTLSQFETFQASAALTYKEIAEEYLDVLECSESQKKNYTMMIGRFCELFGSTPIQQITAGNITSWLVKAKRKYKWGEGNATRNHYMTAIRQPFHFASQNKYISALQHAEISAIQKAKTINKIPDAITMEEYHQMMQILPKWASVVMGLLFQIGFRRADLHLVTWPDIHLDEKILFAWNNKGTAQRKVPMTSYVYTTFQSLRNGAIFWKHNAPYGYHENFDENMQPVKNQNEQEVIKVILGLKNTDECVSKRPKSGSKNPYSCYAIAQVLNKKGIKYRGDGEWTARTIGNVIKQNLKQTASRQLSKKQRADDMNENIFNEQDVVRFYGENERKDKKLFPEQFHKKLLNDKVSKAAEIIGVRITPHVMRHTFATFLRADGKSTSEIAELGGWSTEQMVKRYGKTPTSRLKEVMNSFDKINTLKVAEKESA